MRLGQHCILNPLNLNPNPQRGLNRDPTKVRNAFSIHRTIKTTPTLNRQKLRLYRGLLRVRDPYKGLQYCQRTSMLWGSRADQLQGAQEPTPKPRKQHIEELICC